MAEDEDDLELPPDYEPPTFVITPDMLDMDDQSDEFSSQRPPSPRSVVSPPIIRNPEFIPYMVMFGVFVYLVSFAQSVAATSPGLGFLTAVVILVLMGEWERRARYSFGRIRQRYHFDPATVLKLPVPTLSPVPQEMEPPTPYIPPEQDNVRTDSGIILKRAQETMIGTTAVQEQSPLEIALINVLKEALQARKSDRKEEVKSMDGKQPDKTETTEG